MKLIALPALFAGLLLAPTFAAQPVVTWEPPAGFGASPFYTVKVNGTRVPVYDTPIASWARFDFEGSVDVEVTARADVRWVDIRPRSAGLQPHYVSDHVFTFRVDRPRHLSVELNGRALKQPLFLFCDAPERTRPDRTDPNVIWFEGGKLHRDVALEVKSGQTVYIEGGAIVDGVIFGENVRNVRVLGRGVLEGAKNRERTGAQRRFVEFRDSQDILVEGVVLQNATTWQVAMFNCDRATIRGVKIVSDAASDDGIDLVRCREVLVENVFARTKDDCIAIKSGGRQPGHVPTDNIQVRQCVFWNAAWGNAIEVGFELYSDEVKNIRFEDIDIIRVEDGAAMSIHNAGPAHVHDVVFADIRLEDVRQKLIDIAIFFSQWGPDGIRDPQWIKEHYLHGAWDGVQKIPAGKEEYHRQFRGRVSNVVFRNIAIVDGGLPFSIFHGFDAERNVRDIRIENLTHLGRRLTSPAEARFRLHQTRGLTIE